MLSARLLGASHLETAAGDEGHSDRGAGERRKRGLVLHPSEVGVPHFAVQDITATHLQGCREHLGDCDLSLARGVVPPSQGGQENPSVGQRLSSLPKGALAFPPSVPRG